MVKFGFSTEIVSEVTKELKSAEKYIKIAIFQLHNKQIFDTLFTKLEQGVGVEVFTLPTDSINDNVREEITPLFKELERLGATIHFCRWNIGDPGRTSTAVGRWYSFHGKFIATDKSAICLSANFTENNELDSIIIFYEFEKIEQFNDQFDTLVELFIKPQNGYEGNIREKIIEKYGSNVTELFQLPKVIETDIHFNHWITDYPSSLCPDEARIGDKLYIIPFDARGRNIIQSVINESSNFLYLTTESFTDTDFSMFLSSIVAKKGMCLRILCGATSMDFSDRINVMFRELLALNIDIRTCDEIHSKLIITDKHLVISSINFNKMNLGFSRSKSYGEKTLRRC